MKNGIKKGATTLLLQMPPDTLSILFHWGDRNCPYGCGREFTGQNLCIK